MDFQKNVLKSAKNYSNHHIDIISSKYLLKNPQKKCDLKKVKLFTSKTKITYFEIFSNGALL